MRNPGPDLIIQSYTLAAVGAVALFIPNASAADLGVTPLPPLTVSVENWTGISLAGGGGIGIFDANVNASATRQDDVQRCDGDFQNPNGTIGCNGDWVSTETFLSSQDVNIADLGDWNYPARV
jgi:hypothetical protein